MSDRVIKRSVDENYGPKIEIKANGRTLKFNRNNHKNWVKDTKQDITYHLGIDPRQSGYASLSFSLTQDEFLELVSAFIDMVEDTERIQNG